MKVIYTYTQKKGVMAQARDITGLYISQLNFGISSINMYVYLYILNEFAFRFFFYTTYTFSIDYVLAFYNFDMFDKISSVVQDIIPLSFAILRASVLNEM